MDVCIAANEIIKQRMELYVISFICFVTSFIVTQVISKALLGRIDFLLLMGRFDFRSKKILNYKSAGGIVILAGSLLSLLLIIVAGLVPVLLFIKIILLCFVIVFLGNKVEFIRSNKYILVITQLLLAVLLVFFLDFSVPDVGIFYGYSLAVSFSFLCTLFVRFLNTFERIAILFSISAALFGGVLGIYFNNIILIASNISVLGALVSFSYFNFNKTKKILLGFNGELLIGLSFAGMCLFFLREGLDVFVYNHFLSF
jgi:hypothetical protein